MMFHQANRLSLVVLAGALVAAQVGCAALTESQIDEVGAFGKAAQAYQPFPGEALRAYGEVVHARRTVRIADRTITSAEDAEKAWNRLLAADAVRSHYRALADATDTHLRVIQNYAVLLVALTSSSFGEELEKQSKELGKQLDASIKAANDLADTKIGPVGDAVASAVTGLGQIWLGHRQAQYVKAAVSTADPMVSAVAAEVGALLEDFTGPPLPKGKGLIDVIRDGGCDLRFVLCQQLDEVSQAARSSMERRSGFGLFAVDQAARAVDAAEAAQQLAIASTEATEAMRAAHTRLVDSVQTRMDLGEHLEEIERLIAAIDHARGLVEGLRRSSGGDK